MSLLTAQNLKFGFSDGILFQDAAFKVEFNDRIGLIGMNGTGKTSLFNLIIGKFSPVEGGIVRGKNVVIGYMEQYLPSDDKKTLYEETLTVFSDVIKMEEELENINTTLEKCNDLALIERQFALNEEIERRDGLVYKAKTRSSLIGLGFAENELDLKVSELSGGQRSKMALCKLLLSNANLLLLDEPTNNLDIDAVTWLEDYLLKYKGAYIVVSHDRYFLDKITTSTMEIAHKKLTCIKGNYTEFNKLKQERELFIEKEYEKNIAEIKRIEEIIAQQKRFNQERNYITIASKQKQIDRIKENLVIPDKALKSVHFSFNTELRASDEVLTVDNLSKSFSDKKLFSSLSFKVMRNDKLFILGPNGCGKSTFLKIVNREIYPDSGIIKYGINIKIGYFAQNIDNVNLNKTVLDDVWDMYRNMNMTEIRNALAMFLFCGDDVFKSVSSLSGGEKAKLSLLKIMLSKPNVLILDEPTNHLDISSREVLENALSNFNGTLICVSHDRYFINKLSSRIVFITPNGAKELDGNYDDYLLYKENSQQNEIINIPKKPKINEYQLKKEQASNERKRKTRLRNLENEIEITENTISEIEQELSSNDVAADYEKLLSLTDSLNSEKEKLDSLYEEWEQLQE